jgi:amino acid permease
VLNIGCNYVFGWIIVLPLEITAAGILVSYWLNKSAGHHLLRAFFSKSFDYPSLKDNRLQLATVAINAFGTLGYEEEWGSSCLKSSSSSCSYYRRHPAQDDASAIENTTSVTDILSWLPIGFNLPYNDKLLLFASGETAAASPFTDLAGLNHLINVNLCMSVFPDPSKPRQVRENEIIV